MTPAHVTAKAGRVLSAYLNGEIHARNLHFVKGLALNVSGNRYRWICLRTEQRKSPDAWELLTHSQYTKLIGHGRPI